MGFFYNITTTGTSSAIPVKNLDATGLLKNTADVIFP
jgi:hypothetical protein